MTRWALIASIALVCGCATAPDAPVSRKSSVWGVVRLAPHEGVEIPRGGSGYGDPSMVGVQMVDYSRPGFAVVHLDGPPPPSTAVNFTIRPSRVHSRLEPRRAALAVGGTITVVNADETTHTISCPAGNVVRTLAPGEAVDIRVERPGVASLFLLGVTGADAQAFVSPGPYDVVSASGYFRLENIDPGAQRLHVWHARFPPTSRSLDLLPNEVTRVDFEIRVDQPNEETEK